MIIQHRNPYEWHRWFAWYPVSLEGWRTAWLTTIERRNQFLPPCYTTTQYRLPGEE